MIDSDSEAEEDNVIEERYLLAVNVVKATNLKKLLREVPLPDDEELTEAGDEEGD